MAAKTYYLTNALSSNVQQFITEISQGANATISPNYGWTVGTTAAGNYASADTQTMVPAISFGATAQPDGSIVTTQSAGDSWRSPVPLTGSFDAGTWTFQGSVIGNLVVGAAGRCRFRLFRSSNSDGSSATEITSGVVVGSTIGVNSLGQTDSIGTVSLSAFSLTNEYLFVQIGWEITTAASGHGAALTSVRFRSGNTASQVITTNFVQLATQTPCIDNPTTIVTVTDFNVAWSGPENAGQADGNVAQYISTIGFLDENSEYIRATQFGFSVPSNATILGIKAEFDRSVDTPSGVGDYSVLIVKGGSSAGTDQSAGAVWPSTLGVAVFGGATNMWGTTWTPSEINASNFGVQLQVINLLGVGEIARLDQIRMTVYYSVPSGSGMLPMMGIG